MPSFHRIRGDRELISVGNAANQAAKILVGGTDAITVGNNLYDLLSSDEQAWFTPSGNAYRLDCTSIEDIEAIVRDAGVEWSVQSSINKFTEDKDRLSGAQASRSLISYSTSATISAVRDSRSLILSVLRSLLFMGVFMGAAVIDGSIKRNLREKSRMACESATVPVVALFVVG